MAVYWGLSGAGDTLRNEWEAIQYVTAPIKDVLAKRTLIESLEERTTELPLPCLYTTGHLR